MHTFRGDGNALELGSGDTLCNTGDALNASELNFIKMAKVLSA